MKKEIYKINISNKIKCPSCFKISLRKDFLKVKIYWLNGVKCPKCWQNF